MPELFPKPPEQRNKQISVSAVNQLLRAVPRVITGDGVQMKRFGDRYVIEHSENLNQPAPQIQHFVVMEEFDDYVSCVQFSFSDIAQSYDPALGVTLQDLGRTGTLMYVAKPYGLQQSVFEGKTVILNTVEGITTFSAIGIRTFTPTSGGPITQALTPSYFEGEIIAGYEAPTGLSVDDQLVVWTDMNIIGRVWNSILAPNYAFALSTTTITAISGATPGIGLAAIYETNDDGDLEATGEVVTVRNPCSAINPSYWLSLHRTSGDKPWMATQRCLYTPPVESPGATCPDALQLSVDELHSDTQPNSVDAWFKFVAPDSADYKVTISSAQNCTGVVNYGAVCTGSFFNFISHTGGVDTIIVLSGAYGPAWFVAFNFWPSDGTYTIKFELN